MGAVFFGVAFLVALMGAVFFGAAVLVALLGAVFFGVANVVAFLGATFLTCSLVLGAGFFAIFFIKINLGLINSNAIL